MKVNVSMSANVSKDGTTRMQLVGRHCKIRQVVVKAATRSRVSSMQGRSGKTGIATTFVNSRQCSESILLDLKHLLKEAKQRVPHFLTVRLMQVQTGHAAHVRVWAIFQSMTFELVTDRYGVAQPAWTGGARPTGAGSAGYVQHSSIGFIEAKQRVPHFLTVRRRSRGSCSNILYGQAVHRARGSGAEGGQL